MTTVPSSTAAGRQHPGSLDAAGASRERAERWRRTLLPVLERLDSPLLTHAERVRMAVENSARHFVKAKSERQVRRMIAEVLRRDGGAKQWDRLDLYLEKNPPRITAPLVSPAGDAGFDDLRLSAAGFKDQGKPSAEEEAAFLLAAWECHQRQVLNGVSPKRSKAQLLDYLWRWMPWLSSTRRGLTDKISRKFAHYEQGHGEVVSLLDGRAARAGEQRAPAFNPEHTDRLIWHAAKNCGGRVAQAMEDLQHRAEELGLPAEMVEFLLRNQRAGGYVNRRLLDAVRPEVEMLRPYLLGQKAIDDVTVPLQRTYDKLRSMSVVNADDFTMPVYFWLKDKEGNVATDEKGIPLLTRGQLLLFIDVRSLRILHFTLIPERNYDALSIRTGMVHVCREHGVPEVWYFERGIWERSHAVKGVAPAGWEIARSSEEMKFGWEQLGAKFVHAIRARSKPIEKIGDLLQRLMEGEPGYCGRDERRDCPEETKRAKLAVQGRREHPAKHFRSFEEWAQRLEDLVERYNAKPQFGRLAGISPDQAFEKYWPHADKPDDKPERLDGICYHLGAHYVRRCEVKGGGPGNKKTQASGITFEFGKRTFAYWDENLSEWRGREVLAWFNPEQPEFIAVTEPKDRAGFSARFIARHNPTDFMATLDPESPESPAHRHEVAKQKGFNSYPKARFTTLKAKFTQTFRKVAPDLNTALMAANLAKGASEHATAKREEDSAVRRIQEKARRLNMSPTELRDYSEDTEAALDRRLRARRAAHKEMETES